MQTHSRVFVFSWLHLVFMKIAQLAVIGAGPGGYAAAFLAADLGLSVALIDPEVNPGGACVYRGCIPSKTLLHVAKVLDESRRAKAWGVDFGDPRIDLARLRGFKDAVVTRLTGGTGQLVWRAPALDRAHRGGGRDRPDPRASRLAGCDPRAASRARATAPRARSRRGWLGRRSLGVRLRFLTAS